MKEDSSFGGGSGIILCRDKNGSWSGPCAIEIGGISWDLDANVSKVNHIIILPTIDHIRTFMANSGLQICHNNIGRNTNVEFGTSGNPTSSILSYSFSEKGLYSGVNIEGAIITVLHATNETFYIKKVSVEDIVNGNVPIKQNEDYEIIIRLLNNHCPSTSIFINDNNKNGTKHEMITNLTNNEILKPESTEPIIREKPPLIRQKEISLNSIVYGNPLNSNPIPNMNNSNNCNK
jgi:hypothetical protein